jgi:hypothetical protein
LGNDAQYTLRCALPPGAAVLASVAAKPRSDRSRFRQELFEPGAGPWVTRLVRADPGNYGRQPWMIPLYAQPFDNNHVRRLALSVLCGRDTHCVVEFEGAIAAADCGRWLGRGTVSELVSAQADYAAGRVRELPCRKLSSAGHSAAA